MNATDSSINIALRHIKTALIFLPIFFIVMFLDSKSFNVYFFMNTNIIALTHIFTLGFLMMVIIGASYMLLPVALGVKIAYEKLFFPVYYVFVISLLLFIVGMYYFIPILIASGGILLFISVLAYDLNMLLSLKKVKKWDYTAIGIAFAYSYLFIGLSVGLYLALSFYFKTGFDIYGILKDHVYLMFVGFVVMLFIAISYRLLPMFYMTKSPGNLSWKTDLAVINGGIIFLLVSSFFGTETAVYTYLNDIGGWLLGIGTLMYSLIFFNLMLKRLKKKFDVTTFYLFSGATFLIISTIIGFLLIIISEKTANINYGIYYYFGFTALFGFAGMVIIGFLHKIFPFLISLKIFEKAKKGAYGKLFSNMQTKYFEYLIFGLFLSGIIIWLFYLIKISSIILLIASLLLLLHIFSMEW
ncbi:hypothetical protein ACMCNP_07250 [Candidatus Acidulodesulfobacterium sp. H_13]|uniref:hypothetical protein n=1 Tax=Candidatus Acidulodesulfobacterium sp. H_13 TaxID=3395470 RepID=UPI003AF93117